MVLTAIKTIVIVCGLAKPTKTTNTITTETEIIVTITAFHCVVANDTGTARPVNAARSQVADVSYSVVMRTHGEKACACG